MNFKQLIVYILALILLGIIDAIVFIAMLFLNKDNTLTGLTPVITIVSIINIIFGFLVGWLVNIYSYKYRK